MAHPKNRLGGLVHPGDFLGGSRWGGLPQGLFNGGSLQTTFGASSSSWGYPNSTLDGFCERENPHRSTWMMTRGIPL